MREDVALRGRERGETAALVTEGVRAAMAEGARCKQVEEVLDEIEAVRHAMARANKGDLVVVCVDKHAAVMAELENWSDQAQAGGGDQPRRPGPPTPTTCRADPPRRAEPRARARLDAVPPGPSRARQRGLAVGALGHHRRRPPGRRPAAPPAG